MKTQHITRGFTFLAAFTMLAACQWAAAQTLTHSYTFDNYDVATQKLWNNAAGVYDATIFTVGGGTFDIDTAVGILRLNGENNGKGAYVELPANLLHGLTSATIEADMAYASFKNFSRVFDMGTNDQNNWWVGYTDTANQLRHEMILNNGKTGENRNNTFPGVEYFFTSVYESTGANSGSFSLYLDGRLVSTHNVNYALSQITGGGSATNYLGKSHFPDNYTDGTYRSFSVYDGAKDAATVLDEYRTRQIGYRPLQDLVAKAVGFWDASGAGTNDISGSGNHLGAFNGAQFVSLADTPIADTFLGSGYAFRDGNGANRYANISNVANPVMDISKSLTVTARVNMDSFNPKNDFIRSGRASDFPTQATYGLGTTNNGELTLYLTPAGQLDSTTFTLQMTDGTNFSLAEDTWYDVTGVFNAGDKTVSLYAFDSLTGDLVASSSEDVLFDSLYLYGGHSRNFMLFETPYNRNGINEGLMAYAGVWDYALSLDEISLLSGNANSAGNSVPEPATWVMLLLGAVSVWVLRRKNG